MLNNIFYAFNTSSVCKMVPGKSWCSDIAANVNNNYVNGTSMPNGSRTMYLEQAAVMVSDEANLAVP